MLSPRDQVTVWDIILYFDWVLVQGFFFGQRDLYLWRFSPWYGATQVR